MSILRAVILPLLLLLGPISWVQAQYAGYSIHHKTVEDGLSQSVVNDIVQDQRGFIWFATNDGLNCYNGYTFKNYYHKWQDSSSISSSEVLEMSPIGSNKLLILTGDKRLNLYNPITDAFTLFNLSQFGVENPEELGITTFMLDRDRYLWLGTQSKGMLRVDMQENRVKHYLADGSPNSITGNSISFIYKDRFDIVWIETKDGGMCLMNNDNSFVPLNLSDNPQFKVFSMEQGIGGYYWLCTTRGLLALSSKLTVEPYQIEELDNKNMAFYSLHRIEDKLYVGGRFKGVLTIDLGTLEYEFLQDKSNRSGEIFSVKTFFQDNSGLLWMGTDGDGLGYLDPVIGDNRFYSAYTGQTAFGKISLRQMDMDKNGALWVGGYAGLLKYDSLNRLQKHYHSSTLAAFNQNTIFSLAQFGEDTLLLGTEGEGLIVMNTAEETFTRIYSQKNDPETLSSGFIFDQFVDSNNIVWCATMNGLNAVDIRSGSISRFFNKAQQSDWFSIKSIVPYREGFLLHGFKNTWHMSLKDNQLTELHFYGPDSVSMPNLEVQHFYITDTAYWVSTRGYGLLKILKQAVDWSAGTVYCDKILSTANGLPNDVVYAALPGNNGELWLSTNQGLVEYDPKDEVIRSFDKGDGLQDNEFNYGSYYRDNNGTLYFGGIKGLTSFNPTNMPRNSFVPPVLITSFKILNKELNVARQIAQGDPIELSFDDDIISFEFASLDYRAPYKLRYAYKLSHNEQPARLIQLGKERTVTFTDLPAGSYELTVIGTNSEGLWNNTGSTVRFFIRPPIWQTWWFRISASAFISVMAVLIFFWRTRLIRRQNLYLARKVQKRTYELHKKNEELLIAKEKAEESLRIKTDFMATMSHEIRTPMNGLLGTTSILMNTALDEEQKDFANTIMECGDNMLAIINDILDYSKIESGKLEADNSECSLTKLIEGVINVFAGRAAKSSIELVYYIEPEAPENIITDKTRLTQVLNNLVSNALKFSKGGIVMLAVKVRSEHKEHKTYDLEFSVKDNGVGIPVDKQKSIFEAFSQADSSTTRKFGGTGLGLAISKKITAMLGGSISVQSAVGVGSVFRFNIKTKRGEKGLVGKQDKSLSGKKLCLISEECGTSAIIENYLKEYGMEMTLADDERWLNKEVDPDSFDFIVANKGGLSEVAFASFEFAKTKVPKIALIEQVEKPIDEANIRSIKKPLRRADLFSAISSNALASASKAEAVGVRNEDFSRKYPFKILLAEDNPVNQMVTKKILGSLGYKIDIASSGLKAVEKYQANPYDVILMDLLMPEMDGIDATVKIRELCGNKNHPIIVAFSANIFNNSLTEYYDKGFNDVLSKPAKLDDVKKLISKLGEKITVG